MGGYFFEGQKNGLPSREPRRLSKHEPPWLSSSRYLHSRPVKHDAIVLVRLRSQPVVRRLGILRMKHVAQQWLHHKLAALNQVKDDPGISLDRVLDKGICLYRIAPLVSAVYFP